MANTSFSTVYDSFLSKITDDMYMELFPEETDALQKELLLTAIPWFEFPRTDISNYDATGQTFNVELTNEEVNILATYMVVAWLSQQLANVDVVKMKYSGSDFKFTSQANHLQKLQTLRDSFKEEGFHLQRLYKRRLNMQSTLSQIMEVY